MKKNWSLIIFFTVLVGFGYVVQGFDKAYDKSKINDKNGNTHYVDDVLIKEERDPVMTEPYRNLSAAEVPVAFKKESETLPEGVYHKEGILVLVPPTGQNYIILNIQETRQEIRVTVAEGEGESTIRYARVVLRNEFPIGVYNKSGHYMY